MIKEGATRSDALAQVMSLSNLTTLFGCEAAQNPRVPFHTHFANRSDLAFARADSSINPFLHQMYEGQFVKGHRYDWLQNNFPVLTEVAWSCGRMTEVLMGLPKASVDLVHISNILDWLSPEQATETLSAATRALKPGGQIIARQLNSSLDFNFLTDEVLWDLDLGRRMEQVDRSFFYPQIFVGTRR